MTAGTGTSESGQRLAGRTAVVAPVGNAIGHACAVRLVKDGANVVVVDEDGDAVMNAVAAVESLGGTARGFTADVASIQAMTDIQRACAAGAVDIDILVTCHFALRWQSIEESTMEEWAAVFRHNALGPLACAKAFLPSLAESQAGSIVHVGSVDGLQGNAAAPSYSASKGALIPLTHVMAEEFAAHGIRVNCVARAAVVDPTIEVPSRALERALEHTPLRRAGDPDEIARVVTFLASEDASYVTGAVVPVDGGRSGLTPGTA